MDNHDDLEAIHQAVLEHIQGLGLVHFPSNLGLGDDKWPVFALWTADDDWRDFLALAPKAGAHVVYTNLDVLTKDDLPDEEEENVQAKTKSLALADHLGEPFRLSVAYVVGVVVHLWMREAVWWQAIEEERAESVELDRIEIDKQYKALFARAAEEGWARKIAEDPRVYCAKRPGAQLQACFTVIRELLGDKAGMMEPPRGPARQAYHRGLNDLLAMVQAEVGAVRVEVEDRALSEIDEMVTQLVAENPNWHVWGFRLRQQKAKRLVTDRYGCDIPAVTAEVAKR